MILLGLVVASHFLPVPVWAWIGIPLGKATVSIATYRFFLRRSFRLPHATGLQALVGEIGVALTRLHPIGQISVRGEIWRARSANGAEIREGRPIRIVAIHDGSALVEPIDPRAT